ncbi:MAG: hypothetical protein IKV19_00740 [Bacteroidaceae bacterium]|nr:hypothetical protein [Bacteroidaceae bacterium]
MKKLFVALMAVLVLASCGGKNKTEKSICGAFETAKELTEAYAGNLEKVIEAEDAEAFVKLYEKYIDDQIEYFEKYGEVLYNVDLDSLTPDEKEKTEALAAEIEELEATTSKLELDVMLTLEFTDEQQTRLDEADGKMETVYAEMSEDLGVEPGEADVEEIAGDPVRDKYEYFCLKAMEMDEDDYDALLELVTEMEEYIATLDEEEQARFSSYLNEE